MLKLKKLNEVSFESCEISKDYCHKVTGGLSALSWSVSKGKYDDIDADDMTRYEPGDPGKKDARV